VIYKGDDEKYVYEYDGTKKVTFTPGPVFFALSPEVAYTYGDVTFAFKLNRDLIVVDLDDRATLASLYEKAPRKIKHIITNNYGFSEEGTRISDSDSDRAFSQFLCEYDINGYVLRHAKTDFGGTFHPEIMLCDAEKDISFHGVVTDISKINVKDLKQKIASKKHAKKPRKKRETEIDSPPLLKKILFDTDTPPANPLITF
jgi:hypothetical protein